jgi:hypothetical protein
MYSNDRNAYRQTFYDAWLKYRKQMPLELIEQQIVAVALEHPEYHLLLQDQKNCLEEEFHLEENPFFHMSLHISILEQIKTNKPSGIKELFAEKILMLSEHEVIHRMMAGLSKLLARAQQTKIEPTNEEYLQTIKREFT